MRPLARKIKASTVTDDNGCWVWQGSLSHNGYGMVTAKTNDGRKTTRRTHRIMYEEMVGPIPNGLVTDHLCRNRACCNPAHLEVVTQRENLLRGETFNARHANATHCIHGHEFTPENTILERRVKGGPVVQRRCRACQKAKRATLSRRSAA